MSEQYNADDDNTDTENVAVDVRKWRGGGIVAQKPFTGGQKYYFHNYGRVEMNGEEYENVVAYVGESNPTHYFESQSTETVPEYILDEVVEDDVVLVEGVEAGWDSWNGRPEFSEPFHDFSKAVVVQI